jgi:transposase
MNHIAIDLGSRESQVCVRDPSATILSEEKIDNRLLPTLFDCPKSVVVMETCAEAFLAADWARQRGHDVRVVPAVLVRCLGVGARRIKTDRRDARALSEASCRLELPSVHVPSSWSREAKSICGMRAALVGSRTKLVNTVRGWLRTQLFPLRCSASAVPKKLSAVWSERGESLPPHLERQLAAIDALTEQIKSADGQIQQLGEQNSVCALLMTAPGVGPVTAVRYAAAVDEVERFAGVHQLQSYLGLTPGEDSSSTRRRITSITKAGPSAVRWLLVQAAWVALRRHPQDPMCRWARRIAERRGKQIAVTALARKLAGVLYAIWRDRQPYQPLRTAAHTMPLD